MDPRNPNTVGGSLAAFGDRATAEEVRMMFNAHGGDMGMTEGKLPTIKNYLGKGVLQLMDRVIAIDEAKLSPTEEDQYGTLAKEVAVVVIDADVRALRISGDEYAEKKIDFTSDTSIPVLYSADTNVNLVTGGVTAEQRGATMKLGAPVNTTNDRALYTILCDNQLDSGSQLMEFETYNINAVKRKLEMPSDTEEIFIKLWLTYMQSVWYVGIDWSDFDMELLAQNGEIAACTIKAWDDMIDIYTRYDVVVDLRRMGHYFEPLAKVAIASYPYYQISVRGGSGRQLRSLPCCFNVRKCNGIMVHQQEESVDRNLLLNPAQLRSDIIAFAQWLGAGDSCKRALEHVVFLCSGSSIIERTNHDILIPTRKPLCIAPSLGRSIWREPTVTNYDLEQEVGAAKLIVALGIQGTHIEGMFEDIVASCGWRGVIAGAVEPDDVLGLVNSTGLLEEQGRKYSATRMNAMLTGNSTPSPVLDAFLRARACECIDFGPRSLDMHRNSVLCSTAPKVTDYGWTSAFGRTVSVSNDTIEMGSRRIFSGHPDEFSKKRIEMMIGRSAINAWAGQKGTPSMVEIIHSGTVSEMPVSVRKKVKDMVGATYNATVRELRIRDIVEPEMNFSRDSIFLPAGDYGIDAATSINSEAYLEATTIRHVDAVQPSYAVTERLTTTGDTYSATAELSQMGGEAGLDGHIQQLHVGGSGAVDNYNYLSNEVPAILSTSTPCLVKADTSGLTVVDDRGLSASVTTNAEPTESQTFKTPQSDATSGFWAGASKTGMQGTNVMNEKNVGNVGKRMTPLERLKARKQAMRGGGEVTRAEAIGMCVRNIIQILDKAYGKRSLNQAAAKVIDYYKNKLKLNGDELYAMSLAVSAEGYNAAEGLAMAIDTGDTKLANDFRHHMLKLYAPAYPIGRIVWDGPIRRKERWYIKGEEIALDNGGPVSKCERPPPPNDPWWKSGFADRYEVGGFEYGVSYDH